MATVEARELRAKARENCPDILKAWWGPDDGENPEERTLVLSNRKGLLFTAFTGLCFGMLAHLQGAPGQVPAEASLFRVLFAFVLAAGVTCAFVVDMYGFPPAQMDQEVYTLHQSVGRPGFLTFWIGSLMTVYCLASWIAELSLLLGRTQYKLLVFCHASAVFVDTLAVVLALLFLKFNYFEEKWRRDMKEYWEKRGYPYGSRSLFVHLVPSVAAVLDMLIKTLMQRANRVNFTPPYLQNVIQVVLFTAAYVSWIHLWWHVSNYKVWPYPFFHDFPTLQGRVAFAAAIAAAICVVMVPFQFLF